MQTELRLFQIPDIDTTILSGIGEFHDRIEQFERFWNMKLEFSPNARWLPGSYERLKGQVVKSLFPNWEKPRGANTIRKLTRFDNYNLGNLQKELIKIDDELRVFRNNKVYLEGDKAAEEGKALLEELMENFSKSVDDVYVDVTPIPYWVSNRYVRRDFLSAIIPIINSDGMLPNPLRGYGRNNRIEKNIKDKMAEAAQSKSPKRWYINIIVSLHDITMHYFKDRSEDKTLAAIPWGTLHVGFTIPLYDIVMNFRRIKNQANLRNNPIDTQHFSNHTYKFPTIPGIQHPFVYRGNNNETNGYEWGNTCFGSWKSEIITALCTGNIAHLKAILVLWSETYHCNNTTPLNQPEVCHLEQHIDWPKGISNYIRTSPTTCRNAVQRGYTTTDLMDNHCIVCVLKEMGECSYYEELTFVPYVMPKEFLDILTEKLIGHNGNPAGEYIVIKRLIQKMWSMKTRTTDAQFNSWFYIQDYGTGFMDYENFLAELDIFNTAKAIHYEGKIAVNWHVVADCIIMLYHYSERVYWTQCVRNYNNEAWDALMTNFDWLDDAQDELPLDELKSMIHTYRLQRGIAGSEPTYAAYLIDIYQLNQAMKNNKQSFEDAIDEMQADANDIEVVTESEGPF